MAVIDRPAQQRANPVVLILLALTALSILLALLPDLREPWVMHVASKRGMTNVEKTNRCKDDADAIRFWNPGTQRYGKVCKVDGQWFVVIMDVAGRIVTGFPKEKMRDIAQVVQYMKNTGYTLIQ